MSDGTLSFERGTTWKDGGTSTASVGAAVVGRSFRGNANNQPSGGVGGNVDQRLRVVKNTATAAITYTAARLRRGVRMSTAASGNNFDAINGFVSTKGARGFRWTMPFPTVPWCRSSITIWCISTPTAPARRRFRGCSRRSLAWLVWLRRMAPRWPTKQTAG